MKAAVTRFIEEIERDSQRRAFGEERARANLMPAVERRGYLSRLRRRAIRIVHRATPMETGAPTLR